MCKEDENLYKLQIERKGQVGYSTCLPASVKTFHSSKRRKIMEAVSTLYTYHLRAIVPKLAWTHPTTVRVRPRLQVFGSAFIQSATMKTAFNGFQSTGIWPTDSSIFTPSTDIGLGRPASEEVVPEAEQLELPSYSPPVEKDMPLRLDEEAGEDLTNSNDDTPAKKIRFDEDSATPGCSWMSTDIMSSSLHVSPKILMPIPKVKKSVKRTNRKREKTAVLTDPPYKKELETAIQEKAKMNLAKEERARTKLEKSKNKKNKTEKNKGKYLKTNGKKKDPKRECKINESDSEDFSDCECLYCGKFYSKSIDGWVACSVCNKWAHNFCAGIDSEDD
ncbi:unnamed protein product [Brassicogethes aeneus]|uniref:Zinc finger PHD-type domain-containing protein n=1 Tax=Brassicogethes aeneus TaxID=1431903 RepID=A0A9P0BDB3_BRAAE|nr:unnamed protein product [Brassicogethes aeneus]